MVVEKHSMVKHLKDNTKIQARRKRVINSKIKSDHNSIILHETATLDLQTINNIHIHTID